TGKTTLLVDRIESLVRSGDAGLLDIAAVTFTENAAATMKLRLRERLERVRVDGGAPEGQRARAADALEVLERAQVSTIHALCGAILQERPLECGVAPGFRVADEAEAESLFAQAWEEWLAERLDASDPVLAEALSREIPLEGWMEAPERWRTERGSQLHAQLVEALQGVLDRYEQKKAAEGALDFVDLLVKARDALRESESVRRHVRERFRHLIIDEFQDTDPLQVQIAQLIAGDDPGRLVVVGDAKQSIYRF